MNNASPIHQKESEDDIILSIREAAQRMLKKRIKESPQSMLLRRNQCNQVEQFHQDQCRRAGQLMEVLLPYASSDSTVKAKATSSPL